MIYQERFEKATGWTIAVGVSADPNGKRTNREAYYDAYDLWIEKELTKAEIGWAESDKFNKAFMEDFKKRGERIKELEVQSYKDMDEYDDVLYQEYALAKDKDLAPKAQELKRAYVVGMRNRIKELEAKK